MAAVVEEGPRPRRCRAVRLLHGVLEAAAQRVPLRLQDALGQGAVGLVEVVGVGAPAFAGALEQPVEDGEAPQVPDLLVREELRQPHDGAGFEALGHHVVEPLQVLGAGVTGVVEGVVDDDTPRARGVDEVVVRQPGPVADVAEDEVDLTARAPPDQLVPVGALDVLVARARRRGCR